MEKRNRNAIALGLLTIIGTGVFLWGLYFLLGNTVLTGGMDITVYMQDGGGLKRGDRVRVQGVEVGSVQSVRLSDRSGVAVQLRLRDDLSLPSDTRAAVTGDVFGAHMIELRPGSALVRLEEGDTIQGASVPAPLELAAGLGEQARSVLTSADSLLSERTIADLQLTAAVLPTSAAELRGAFAEFRLASAALRRTAENVESARTGEHISAALGEIEGSARAMTNAANSMERAVGALESVLAKIDRGQGTLGMLVNDSSLYIQLNETLREVRALATDVRERPSRYINLKIF